MDDIYSQPLNFSNVNPMHLENPFILSNLDDLEAGSVPTANVPTSNSPSHDDHVGPQTVYTNLHLPPPRQVIAGLLSILADSVPPSNPCANILGAVEEVAQYIQEHRRHMQ